jgi:hypothetical protein
MTLLKHFDYTPDQADASVRFELRSQAPDDDGEARLALTVVDLESDENLTIQLAPPDVQGLIEALDETLDELAPSEEGVEEEGAEEEDDEEQAEEQDEEPEPEPERPARRSRGKRQQQED